ncbi:beta-ketoacyl synthase N-terminal-like domain-containing protein [Geomonas anaerohicana]|uniref:Beta-ketoacyl synthase chain length factor n=1 Tax=Geomonas anaerohicana TaxID=2798583 RepID=A0ABS0Y8U4_9BACT|nr:beta-ketoacyl synthase N-terminal-like domain-containing protein [Geomonas anaerohicana]MBJ6748720.1 beta-ketoacyl synthase chain length factor [Geomonas anaerohicana]
MTRLLVKGIGVAGAFGTGVESFQNALAEGRVTVGSIDVATGEGVQTVPAYRADTAGLEEFVPKRALRRVDHYSKLALLGSYLALKDAEMLGADLGRIGLVIASGYGATATTYAFLDSLISGGDNCASPTHFANSVHNAAAANVAITLGIRGPSLTVSQFDMSVPSALVSARQWLAEGRVDAVLFGAIDEVSELVAYLQHRRCGPRHAVSMVPFDAGSESSIIGEGAAFLVLTRDEGGPAYCGIDSVATGNIFGGELSLPDDALLLLGADGRSELARRYLDAVPAGGKAACYTPLYGCMPAAAAFDLAAAALALKSGRAFASPAGPSLFAPGKGDVSRICSLRLAGPSEYATVVMSC